MSTIFGFEHERPAGFEDATVYRFLLGDEHGGVIELEGPAEEAKGPALGRMEAIMAVPGAVEEARRTFRANLTVTRTETDAPLEAFAAEQQRALVEGHPGAEVLESAERRVASLPAREALIAVPIAEPAIELVQWQVTLLRDGYGYCFFATTARSHWERHRAPFAALVDGWR